MSTEELESVEDFRLRIRSWIRANLKPVSASQSRGPSLRAIDAEEEEAAIKRDRALQRAFFDEQACQCGYCSNGMIIAAQALLARNPKPSEADVKQALDGHLCRCGAHNRIVRAVLRASQGS